MICSRLQECVVRELNVAPEGQCDNDKSICVESSDKRRFVRCQEHNKRYVLENTKQNHIVAYRMDGGIVLDDASVPKGTYRCDYLYVIADVECSAVLTELKGTDVRRSLVQIYGTLTLFQNFFKSFSHVYARIVMTSSTPNLKASPEYVKLVKLIRMRFGGNIKMREKVLEEKDIQLSEI